MKARTIHRLLEVDPRTGGFRRDADHLLDCGLLVVDETSMVDLLLMHALLKAVPNGAALLIVGDVDQLSGPARFLPMSSPPGRCRWCASPRCSARQRRAGSSSTPIASTRARCPNSVNSRK